MVELDPTVAATRAVDIQKGMQDVPVGIPHYWFDRVILSGESARIAANLRGFDVVDIERLNVMATEIGIAPSRVRDTIIPELELGGLIRIRKSGSKITHIEEKIPISFKLVETIGKLLVEKELEPVEIAGIHALELTSASPLPRQSLLSALKEVNEDLFGVVLDCGRVGQFMDEYVSPKGERIVYSPLVWNQKGEEVLKMFSELQTPERDELYALAKEVSSYPGKPAEKLSPINELILSQATRSGFLQKTTVTTSSGSKDYFFIPGPKYRIEAERSKQHDLFDRAKLVLSCVRHGQHYGRITRILYPQLLLERLMERGKLSPHSEFKEQYALLDEYGIARVEQTSGGRQILRLVESDENRQILQTAIELLRGKEAPTARVMDVQARELLFKGDFVNPARNRAKGVRPDIPGVTYKTMQKMLERLRGESVE